MTVNVNGRRRRLPSCWREGENEEAEPSEGKGRRQKESIVTTRLNFMNIIFQQMSWTIGRRRRRRRCN